MGNLSPKFKEILSFPKAVLRIFWISWGLTKMLMFNFRIFGHRKLYSDDLKQCLGRFTNPHPLYQLIAFYYVRYALIQGVKKLLKTKVNVSRKIYWTFGILRDYMTILDGMVDEQGITLEEARSDPMSRELRTVLDEYLGKVWPTSIKNDIKSSGEKAEAIYEETEHSLENNPLSKDDLRELIQKDSGSFGDHLMDISCILFSHSRTDKEIYSVIMAYTLSFTLIDDFLDLEEDHINQSFNPIICLMMNYPEEHSLFLSDIQQNTPINYKWLQANAPKTLDMGLAFFEEYFNAIQEPNLKMMVETVLVTFLRGYSIGWEKKLPEQSNEN